MPSQTFHNYNSANKFLLLATAFLSLFLVFCASSLFASSADLDYETTAPANKPAKQSQEGNLTSELESQARMYRAQGFQLQSTGEMDTAMALYQKAIELDPKYAIPYNDLGIILETKGLSDRAEESYLRAIKADPKLLGAYSNLANLYENRRQLNKALYYWKKRVDLGSPDDPWTKKAESRSKDIQAILGNFAYDPKEDKIISMVKEVRSMERKDNKALAAYYFDKAKSAYENGDKVVAYKQAIDAMQLDPDNKDIARFIEKTQKRLLSR